MLISGGLGFGGGALYGLATRQNILESALMGLFVGSLAGAGIGTAVHSITGGVTSGLSGASIGFARGLSLTGPVLSLYFFGKDINY